MKAVGYYFTLPFIYLISLLPFWCLYLLSDFLFVILYYIVGYRRTIVFNNLKNSFPNKTEEELKTIEKKFFRYFCDLVLETLKSITMSSKSVKDKVSFKGEEILKEYFNKNQSIIIVMGHWGNWEYGGARFALENLHQLFVIYHPLQNVYFDRLVFKMRTRFGNGLYTMNDSFRGIIRDKDKLTATAFIADQTPSAKSAHWMPFLNQDTPIFVGTGKIASKMKYPVIYIGINRIKRGSYEMVAEKLIEDPIESNAVEIIETFTKRLEKDIEKVPEIWLWSHRRWKHKRQLNKL